MKAVIKFKNSFGVTEYLSPNGYTHSLSDATLFKSLSEASKHIDNVQVNPFRTPIWDNAVAVKVKIVEV